MLIKSKELEIFIILLLFHTITKGKAEYTCETPEYWLTHGDISKYYKTESANKNKCQKWPDGIIKYHLNPSLSDQDIIHILKAIQEFHNKTCLRFEPTDRSDQDYVSIEVDNTVCGMAHVCKKGGYQFAKFGGNCRNSKTMIHQLSHTIGLAHVSRVPPDLHFTENERQCSIKSYGDPVNRVYNSASQMQVGCHAENQCGHVISDGLSSLDVDYINDIYNCQGCKRHRWIPIEGIKPSDIPDLAQFDFFDLSESPIFPCRAYFGGDVVVGRFKVEFSTCYISINGVEFKMCEGFEVLVFPGGKRTGDSEYTLVGGRDIMTMEELESTVFKYAVAAGHQFTTEGFGTGYVAYGVIKNLGERCGYNDTKFIRPDTNTDVIGNFWRYKNQSEAVVHFCGKEFRLSTFYVVACKEIQVEIAPSNLTYTAIDDIERMEAQHLTYIYLCVAFAVGIVILTLLGLTVYGIWKGRSLTRKLDSEDLREFFNGRVDSEQRGDYNSVENALVIPYNKSQEISRESLKIDATKVLGTGQFGWVVKAELKLEEGPVEVAVKMTRSDVSKTALKGLLSEIKILSYLGSHKNLVSMHGAYTAELEDGIVYLATELCGLGSLESYLRSTQNGAVVDERYINVISSIKFVDLLRWSHEIACGMEYLGTKHVVHADLATRNVLLTLDKTAKINDFGLSRRMYDYQNYVKTHQEPLPWRWMAIESLKRCEFSARSDVWSYGVTLWEIFKLGDTPYPGLSWTIDFVDDLVNGLRLSCPPFATPEIYDMMYGCWRYDPLTRPTFSLLKNRTDEILRRAISLHNEPISCAPDYINININEHSTYINEMC